jgi:serine/threonine-protein kinase
MRKRKPAGGAIETPVEEISLDDIVEQLRAGPEGPELPPGTRVGEYQVEAAIGHGGMGVIYSAVHPVIGKRAAVKVVRADYAHDRDSLNRFVAEARAVNAIGHPNIVDIVAFGALPDGRPFIVMELLEGETLRQRLRTQSVLPFVEVAAILLPVCNALTASHKAGIVHRDLKPENIMLARGIDGSRIVKLLDFGVARLQRSSEHTRSGVILGTPRYMAPEQCRTSAVDARADLYSVGVLLYETLTGKAPFAGRTVAEIEESRARGLEPIGRTVGVPAALETLVARLLDRDPDRRPASASEVLLELVAVLGREGNLPSQSTEKAAPLPVKRRSGLARGILILAALVAGGYFAVPYLLPQLLPRKAPPPPPVAVPIAATEAPATAPAGGRAPPAEPPKETTRTTRATLILRTDQPRASFTLDGVPVGDGTGMLRLEDLEPGTYRISADARFHRPRTERFKLRAGELRDVKWALTRAHRGKHQP